MPFSKADRAAWAATLEQYRPSSILVVMLGMVIGIIALSMFLATSEPTKTEEFIGTVERLTVERRDGLAKRLMVVKVATGESVTLPIGDEVVVRQGAEVRLSRGVASGGRIMYDFVGYLEP